MSEPIDCSEKRGAVAVIVKEHEGQPGYSGRVGSIAQVMLPSEPESLPAP